MASFPNGASSFLASGYLSWYHEEQTKVSMVSGSRLAGFLHFGHSASMNSATSSSGERPLGRKSFTLGSTTGRSSSGTGIAPQSGQCTTGIGAPQ